MKLNRLKFKDMSLNTKYCYDYPRPAVTADCVILGREGVSQFVLLIQRAFEPFKDCWAFPGGFMEMDETIEVCAQRELEEETGLKHIPLKQFYTFSKVDRDPRGRTISIAFLGQVDKESCVPVAGDDAGKVQWFPLDQLPPLAFDHDEVLQLALQRI